MELIDEQAYIVGIFGRLQKELIEMKLIHDNGVLKTRREMKNFIEIHRDAVAIYDGLCDYCRKLDIRIMKEKAEESNVYMRKLINEQMVVNNYLMSMLMLRAYLDDVASKDMADKYLPKVARNIKAYRDVSNAEDLKVLKITSRVADNMWRLFTGRCQLSDEVRDAKFKKIIKNPLV